MKLKNAITGNFQLKIFSLLAAIIIWAIVNKSITSTRSFSRVPIRIVNIPTDKTIRGLMPNNILDRKLVLTLTGTKDVVDRLEPQDFEVVIDAADKGPEWILRVTKKNLVSLNPDIDLMHNVTNVAYNEIIVQLCPLVTEKIPVFVFPPRGEAPIGYQYLDVWPPKLSHIVSGPEEDVRRLQQEGLELIFDLSDISKADLDKLRTEEGSSSDEVSFFVPDSWKKVSLPFLNNMKQEINGPEARNIRIDFLCNELLPLERAIPVRVFYPLKSVDTVNPSTLSLGMGGALTDQKGVSVLSGPFFVIDVSRVFLDIVRDRLEIVISAPENGQGDSLRWEVQFIDPQQLEESYVMMLLSRGRELDKGQSQTQSTRQHQLQREYYLRARFREYMQRFNLFIGKDKPLKLKAYVSQGKIKVES